MRSKNIWDFTRVLQYLVSTALVLYMILKYKSNLYWKNFIQHEITILLCHNLNLLHNTVIDSLQFCILPSLPGWKFVLAADPSSLTKLFFCTGAFSSSYSSYTWVSRIMDTFISKFMSSMYLPYVFKLMPVFQALAHYASVSVALYESFQCLAGAYPFIFQCHHNCYCCLYSHLLYYFFDNVQFPVFCFTYYIHSCLFGVTLSAQVRFLLLPVCNVIGLKCNNTDVFDLLLCIIIVCTCVYQVWVKIMIMPSVYSNIYTS